MGVKLSWHAGGKAAVTSPPSALLLAEAELLLFVTVYLTLIRRKCLVNRAAASSLTQADGNKKEDLMQNWSQTGRAKRNRCVFTLNFKEQKDAAHISGPQGSSAAPERQRSSSQDAAQQGDSVHSCWRVTEKSSSIMPSEPGAYWQDLQHWNILHVFRVVSPVFSKLWNTWEERFKWNWKIHKFA